MIEHYSDQTYYIYALTEPSGDVRYIGKTLNVVHRYRQHLCPSEFASRTHKANWLRSLAKRDEQPDLYVVEIVPPGVEINARERFWIARYRSLGYRLVNGTDGGEGKSGYTPSDESRARMSEAHRGKTLPLEQRIKIGAAQRGRPMPQFIKARLREINRGRVMSAQTRRKMSESMRRGRTGYAYVYERNGKWQANAPVDSKFVYLALFDSDHEAAFAANTSIVILGLDRALNLIPADAITPERMVDIERQVHDKLVRRGVA